MTSKKTVKICFLPRLFECLVSPVNESKILCQLERQKMCIFVLLCSLVIMRVNIFSEVYWSFLFPFHGRSCSCHSYDIRLCCCVLDEGTLGLRNIYASLWLLPREKGAFQHLHHRGCSGLLLFFTPI